MRVSYLVGISCGPCWNDGARRFEWDGSGYSPILGIGASLTCDAIGATSIDERACDFGVEEIVEARISAGILSDVLSTVIDRPCVRDGGGCGCETGVEKILLGTGCATLPVVDRVLSIDARDGGGGIALC